MKINSLPPSPLTKNQTKQINNSQKIEECKPLVGLLKQDEHPKNNVVSVSITFDNKDHVLFFDSNVWNTTEYICPIEIVKNNLNQNYKLKELTLFSN